MKVSTTAERLKEYMNKHNLKQVDILAKTEPYCKKYNVKMNKSDLSQYISGKTEPGQDKLVVLAKALNVSEIWLMGYSEEESTSNNDTSPKDMDIRRIERARKNMTQKEWDKMMKILEVSFEEYFTDKYVDTTDYSDEDED